MTCIPKRNHSSIMPVFVYMLMQRSNAGPDSTCVNVTEFDIWGDRIIKVPADDFISVCLCESGDFLAKSHPIQVLKQEEIGAVARPVSNKIRELLVEYILKGARINAGSPV